jgi:hypothetical protein
VVIARTARYRVGQFLAALRARRAGGLLIDDPAHDVLPPELLALFERMPPEDRAHGLEVLRRLRAHGQEDPVLLSAALLHDVGKAEARVGLVHRALRVLLARSMPALWRWLCWPTGWRRPFWVVANHPARGAVWVETAGGTPELCALIRHHEAPAPAAWVGTPQARRHAALRAVDAAC